MQSNKIAIPSLPPSSRRSRVFTSGPRDLPYRFRRSGARSCIARVQYSRKLRINERTLEKWEQGRAKPNPQAAALVLLVRKYPDTLARLDEVAEG